jgi:2-polyprenyl-6-methoxyphenol hydroxylase-like FAD-dependent oxidoreductase
MPREHTDVLIVGGGPAGLAAAIVFGRNGLRVVVCERGLLPRDKACGEGLMPTGVRHLDELGATPFLDPRQLKQLRGIRFQTMGGSTGVAEFAEGYGLGLRRTNLSAALMEVVHRQPNVKLRQRTCIRRIERLPNGICAELEHGKIVARLIVGADGINSWVRRWAGLQGPARRLRRLGARQHLAITPSSPYVEVIQGRGVEAYVTPCGENQVGLAFLWDPSVLPGSNGGPDLIPSLLGAFPDLKRRFDAAPLASKPLASGPLHRVARSRVGPGVILIGDAGGYVDACTGEGVSIALAEALALESTVVPVLMQPRRVPTAADLSLYASACRRITRPYEFGTRLQLYLCRHPRLADRVIRALNEQEGLMSHFVSANMGTASFWPGWRPAVGLMRSLCRPGCNLTHRP